MLNTTSRSLLSVVVISVVGVAGCAVDEPEVEVAYRPLGCSTCETNGLVPAAVVAGPVELDVGHLTGANLRVAGGVRPLCAAPPTLIGLGPGKRCTLHTDWESWTTAPPPGLLREIRHALVTYIVKVGARNIDRVEMASGVWLKGGFGLAPDVLVTPFDPHTQSILSAGMAAMADYYANGIETCLKTATTPDCPASYQWHELGVVANWFEGRPELVVGGYDAERPEDSRRVCQGSPTPCTTYAAIAPYHAGKCIYGGPWTQRYPISCSAGPGAPTYIDAVQVFLPFDPKTFGSVPYGPPRL